MFLVSTSGRHLEALLLALSDRPHRQPADGDDDRARGYRRLRGDDDEVVLAEVGGERHFDVFEREGGSRS